MGAMFANPAPLTNKLFSYIYGAGIDDILTMEQSSAQGINTYYYHTNALGSTVAVTDASGAVAERYEYTAYGAVSIYNASYYRLEWSAIGNVYLFTGREYDAESGLYYYRTRYYNPVFGRFMQRDAIGIWGDLFNRGNGYGYVGNNGVNWVDPWGLDKLKKEKDYETCIKKELKAIENNFMKSVFFAAGMPWTWLELLAECGYTQLFGEAPSISNITYIDEETEQEIQKIKMIYQEYTRTSYVNRVYYSNNAELMIGNRSLNQNKLFDTHVDFQKYRKSAVQQNYNRMGYNYGNSYYRYSNSSFTLRNQVINW